MKLLDYIKGLRKGKDAHRIELEAMKDSFLSEALEGYDSVKGDHMTPITRMQERITRRSQIKMNYRKYWSVAAGVLLCISIGSYFLLQKPQQELYSSSDLEKSEPTSPFVSEKNESEALEENTLSQPLVVEPQKQSEKQVRVSSPVDQSLKIQRDSELPVAEMIEQKKSQSLLPLLAAESPQKVSLSKEKVAGVSGVIQPSNKLVYGKIVDEHGEPLIGASIVQKGTQSGAIAGLDGTFQLETVDTIPLVANYLGYFSKEIPLDTSNTMLIALNPNNQVLSEVVVGYSVSKRSSKEVAVRKSEPVIGRKKYDEYLKTNLIYPTDSICKNERGTVILRFAVDQDGTPIHIVAKKSLCSSSDREAIRLLTEGCQWTPGKDMVELKVKF